MKFNKYEIIWWGLRDWRNFQFVDFNSYSYDLTVYQWFLHIGPLEIRKWKKLK